MLARKWWTVIAVCVATFMLLLDVTVVNVALPQIERDLDASLTDLQWVIDAYALALAALTLVAGSLGDRFGRRLVFTIGLGVFTIASFLCGIAADPLFLDFARALQGLGGAAMFGTALALIAQEFPAGERGAALGVWGATVGAAVAVGPLVDGLLTEGLGWEWVFFVNVPVGAAAIAITLARLDESRDPAAGPVDWAGVGTFSGALFLLIFGLLRGSAEGWSDPLILAPLAGSVGLLVAFVVVELRRDQPMLDLRLFRVPTFAGASIVAFALAASLFAMLLYIVLYLQNVLGHSPLGAGLRFLPLTLLSFFVAPLAARLSQRVPRRALLGTGLLLVGAGLMLMHGVGATSEWTALLAGLVVAGIGVGLVNPVLADVALAVLPLARAGIATGANNTFRVVGVATGIAALGAVLQNRVEARMVSLLGAVPDVRGRESELAALVGSGNAQQAIEVAPLAARPAVGQAASEAFVAGFNDILLVAACVAFAGAVLAFSLVRTRYFHAESLGVASGAGG